MTMMNVISAAGENVGCMLPLAVIQPHNLNNLFSVWAVERVAAVGQMLTSSWCVV